MKVEHVFLKCIMHIKSISDFIIFAKHYLCFIQRIDNDIPKTDVKSKAFHIAGI